MTHQGLNDRPQKESIGYGSSDITDYDACRRGVAGKLGEALRVLSIVDRVFQCFQHCLFGIGENGHGRFTNDGDVHSRGNLDLDLVAAVKNFHFR